MVEPKAKSLCILNNDDKNGAIKIIIIEYFLTTNGIELIEPFRSMVMIKVHASIAFNAIGNMF